MLTPRMPLNENKSHLRGFYRLSLVKMLKLITSIGILVSLVGFGDAQVGFGGGSSVPGACVCATMGSCSLAGGKKDKKIFKFLQKKLKFLKGERQAMEQVNSMLEF